MTKIELKVQRDHLTHESPMKAILKGVAAELGKEAKMTEPKEEWVASAETEPAKGKERTISISILRQLLHVKSSEKNQKIDEHFSSMNKKLGQMLSG